MQTSNSNHSEGEVTTHVSIMEKRGLLYLAAAIIVVISCGFGLPLSVYMILVARRASIKLTNKGLIYRLWTTKKIPYIQISSIKFPPVYLRYGGAQTTISRDTQNNRLRIHSTSHVATMILLDTNDKVIISIPFTNFSTPEDWILRLIHQSGATVYIE